MASDDLHRVEERFDQEDFEALPEGRLLPERCSSGPNAPRVLAVQRKCFTDSAGRMYRYGYDSLNSLTQITDPLGKVTTFLARPRTTQVVVSQSL